MVEPSGRGSVETMAGMQNTIVTIVMVPGPTQRPVTPYEAQASLFPNPSCYIVEYTIADEKTLADPQGSQHPYHSDASLWQKLMLISLMLLQYSIQLFWSR